MFEKMIKNEEITMYKIKNDALLHLYELFLGKKKLKHRIVDEWFSHLKGENFELAFSYIEKYLKTKKEKDFYYFCVNYLDKPIEKTMWVDEYEREFMFEDSVFEHEYPKVPDGYKGLELYHALDYEHSLTITDCFNNFIFDCIPNNRTVCASNNKSICGNLGFIFEGKEILIANHDIYSCVNYEKGERTVPYFAFKDSVLTEYVGELNGLHEILVKPKKIKSIFHTDKYTENEILDLMSEEVKSFVIDNKINFVKINKL